MQTVQIEELESILDGLKNEIIIARTDLANPSIRENSIRSAYKQIEKLTERINRDKYALDNAQFILDNAKSRVQQLQTQIKVLKNKKKIDKLLKLQAEAAALEGELDADVPSST